MDLKNLGTEKWLAIAAMAAGGFMVGSIALSAWGSEHYEYYLPDLLFIVVFTSLGWLPAAFSMYFGIALLRDSSTQNIRGAAGALIALAILTLAFAVPIPYVSEESSSLIRSALLLAGTIVAIPVHMVVCRAVTRRAGIATSGYREFFSEFALALAVVQIFLIGPNLVERFAPRNPRYQSLVAEPWMSGGYLGSLVLAWLCYRVTVWLVKRGQPVAQSVVHTQEPLQSR